MTFEDNFFDSVHLTFYKDKLLYLDLFASGNVNVEYLKYGIRGNKESGMSKGTAFRGTYRDDHSELHYFSKDDQMTYWYREDMVDNVAMLRLENRKMLRRMIHIKI